MLYMMTAVLYLGQYCVKSAIIQSLYWPVFQKIRTERKDLQCGRKNFILEQVSHSAAQISLREISHSAFSPPVLC